MSDSYTVLARKYRSQDFASLIGQDVLVKTLTTAINTDRIAHAYIFTGIRGTGKTSTARILAKALNCLSSDHATATPCGKCENCTAIAAGQHIDVMEIDAASHTGVDNMRDILDAAQYRPTNGRYKVYIIDEVHMLSTSAFNALLKTLEEPPAHIIFILATTEIRKVPVTILSRCQRFDLVRVPVETLKKHFAWIAEQEKIELSDDANELISRAADGSVRDGLSLLDQAIAQTGGKVDRIAVLDMLKRADRVVVLDFMKTLLSGDTADALAKSDALYQNGADLALLLLDMMEWTHWMTRMHPTLRAGIADSAPYSADQREDMQSIAALVTLNTLSRLWQVMVASVPEMQAAGNQKQCFDMLVVRLMHIADLPPLDVLLAQNEGAKCKAQSANTILSKASDAASPQKSTQSPDLPAAQSQNDTKISINTPADLVAALSSAKEILLLSAWNNNIEVSEFADGRIKFFNRRGDKDFAAKLSKWLADNTGKQWRLELLTESENAPTPHDAEKSAASADPMVSAAMDLFAGAEIVKIN
ncbi:MAG: DNA polymerase III subunit gamma/tau [Rickettsiales bacterium]|jgi:DNA polymerase-3 subunit gamma/tau|nr:DNA polymerase III subunit gamma/tau [Rickettsiales bacterium]